MDLALVRDPDRELVVLGIGSLGAVRGDARRAQVRADIRGHVPEDAGAAVGVGIDDLVAVDLADRDGAAEGHGPQRVASVEQRGLVHRQRRQRRRREAEAAVAGSLVVHEPSVEPRHGPAEHEERAGQLAPRMRAIAVEPMVHAVRTDRTDDEVVAGVVHDLGAQLAAHLPVVDAVDGSPNRRGRSRKPTRYARRHVRDVELHRRDPGPHRERLAVRVEPAEVRVDRHECRSTFDQRRVPGRRSDRWRGR